MSHPKDKHEQEQHHCNCYDPEHHFPGAVLLTDDPASVERLASALHDAKVGPNCWEWEPTDANLPGHMAGHAEEARAIIERLREGVES